MHLIVLSLATVLLASDWVSAINPNCGPTCGGLCPAGAACLLPQCPPCPLFGLPKCPCLRSDGVLIQPKQPCGPACGGRCPINALCLLPECPRCPRNLLYAECPCTKSDGSLYNPPTNPIVKMVKKFVKILFEFFRRISQFV